MKRENLNILVVEDSTNDQLLLLSAFKSCSEPGIAVQTTTGGEEAVEYLTGTGRFSDRVSYPYPSFLITDLKMPKGDGFSVLAHLKSTPDLCIVPTVVLSGSSDSDDVRTAYGLGASAYLVKPATYVELTAMMRTLLDFWMTCEVPQVNKDGEQVITAHQGKLGERISLN